MINCSGQFFMINVGKFAKRMFMTFSILACDPETNAIGGAAATGSLCVGGWVLRGDVRVGMSASQGAAPSTFWGEDVLGAMKAGQTPRDAVQSVVSQDKGRAARQLSALSISGLAAAHTGDENQPARGSRIFEGGVVAGNLLASEAVLDAVVEGYLSASGSFAERLLQALQSGDAAGSDTRGLQSSALLVLSPDTAPLTLRVDYSPTPLSALQQLYARATQGDYHAWSQQVPTLNDPERVLD